MICERCLARAIQCQAQVKVLAQMILTAQKMWQEESW